LHSIPELPGGGEGEEGGSATASRVEIIAHARVPLFHTEHCVFARSLH
jgi:hypothetical protein